MVYGIFSTPSIFQSVMDRIPIGIRNVNCYLDDILIPGKDFSNCYMPISQVIEKSPKFWINLSKCEPFGNVVKNLGHSIGN